MEVKTIDGQRVQIDMDEAKHVYDVMAGKSAEHHLKKSHHFVVGGRPLELTVDEMKEIADCWWEHYGKSGMEKFFSEYQKKAAENIRKAVHAATCPENEPEVKKAITFALTHLPADAVAEVIFEAMEWETAYSGLKSIEQQ